MSPLRNYGRYSWKSHCVNCFVKLMIELPLNKKQQHEADCTTFKSLCPLFLSNFVFLPNDSRSKTMKNAFYFIKKALFVLKKIKFFQFPSFPLFLPVGHCFRRWSKINLKVYATITHFVWYLEKEKSMTLTVCP